MAYNKALALCHCQKSDNYRSYLWSLFCCRVAWYILEDEKYFKKYF